MGVKSVSPGQALARSQARSPTPARLSLICRTGVTASLAWLARPYCIRSVGTESNGPLARVIHRAVLQPLQRGLEHREMPGLPEGEVRGACHIGEHLVVHSQIGVQILHVLLGNYLVELARDQQRRRLYCGRALRIPAPADAFGPAGP